jgi:peptide-methionine (R)-S-oxide reductase
MNSHTRRTFLIGAIAAPLALQAKEQAARSATVVIENFSAAGKSLGKSTVPRTVKTDAEWRKQLGNDSFVVTRHEGTERPYSGKYNDNHADGIYRCICCETALFDSKTKFESGTGWPSFWKAISSANVREIPDNSLLMQRTAVECTRCDAHLGHVFDDGPDPTGLRYCMNSVSLNFVARPRG